MGFDPAKLKAFVNKNKTKSSQTGGKGSIRRKKKVVRRTATQNDKKLKNTLNRLNFRDIAAIEEVNLFRDDGKVIHFKNPKVQASINANTYVVSGSSATKELQELLPDIMNQVGKENLADIKKLYESAMGQQTGGESDDDVPDLVENFEDVSNNETGGDDDDVPELVES